MNTRLVATCRTALAVGALIYAMAATAAMAAVSPPRPASEQPPNVVLLLADDLDLAVLKSGLDAGLYPHIAALLTTSTSFSNAFVSLSSCGPSRATYLTGQFPHNHGTIRNSGPNGGFQSFNDQATTGVWLQAAGYRTGLIGKYINGYGGSQANYTPPGWNVWHALIDLAQYNYRITVPGGVQTYGAAPTDYQTDVVAGYADQFIRSSGSGPFFLKVTPTAPHLEGENDFGQPGSNGIRPPPRYVGTATVPLPMKNLASYNEANLSDKPAWMRHSHKADTPTMKRVFNEKRTAMRAIDDMVGRLVATLQETGHWDNTLFALASDNGFQYGTHRRILRKLDFYEESIRVPLIVKEPGQTTGLVSQAWVVANNDWAPTVLDYAGLAPPQGWAFDGRSLRPHVSGQPVTGRHTVLVEFPPNGLGGDHVPFYAVRTRDPALTLDPTGSRTLVYAQTMDKDGALTDVEHYDLGTDALQIGSLHLSGQSEHALQRELLRARLQALRACAGAGCAALED